MKVFLIVLMILAILFAIYEGIMFAIDIRKKVLAKRQKKKEQENNLAVKNDDTAGKE